MKLFRTEAGKKEPVVVALVLFLLSAVVGGIYARITQGLLESQIDSINSRYFTTILQMDISYWDLYWHTVVSLMKSFLFVWIFSLTIFGIPYLAIAIGWKGFQVGYLMTGLCLTYEWKGLLLMIVYHFPQMLLYIPAALLCLKGCYSLTNEVNRSGMSAGLHNISLLKKYYKLIIIVVVALLAGALLETFVGTYFVRKALTLF